MIVERIDENILETPASERPVDPVYFTRESLARTHQRVSSQGGRVIHLSLDDDRPLREGDVLYRDGDTALVAALQEEDALVVRPRDTREWAVAAYSLGNLHAPVYIDGAALVLPYDPAAAALLEKLGAPCAREQRKLRGMYAGAGFRGHCGHAAHDHGPAHGHAHDPLIHGHARDCGSDDADRGPED
jgi:urease accessory protein